MTHRSAQILDAIAALVRTRVAPSGNHVFTHRRLSLDPDQDETPAMSVDFGDLSVDMKDPDEDYFDCSLAVLIRSVDVNAEEGPLRESLMTLAVQQQAAVNSVSLLGLGFVFDVIYTGWAAPDIDASGERLVGIIDSSWQIKFRMQFQDPGATGSVPNL
jgi:hypothetical protein